MQMASYFKPLALLKILVVLAIGAVLGFLCSPEMRSKIFSSPQHSVAEHPADEHGDEHGDEADHDHEAEAAAGAEKAHAEDADGHAGEEAGHHEGETAQPKTSKPTFDHPHAEDQALSLSEQAKANIGVRLRKVQLGSFEKTITVPSMVVERPGWTTLDVTAPMTGVVVKVFPLQGEAVQPGQPLFEVRLTHEDLLQKQTDFLKSLEELDVLRREVKRLEVVAAEGAIAGKTLLERKYEQQKQEAALRADRQALLLHGLSEEQIAGIEKNRTLLQTLVINASATHAGGEGEKTAVWYQVQELKVSQGTHVTSGSTLCKLVDHAELYLEGKAFEQDVPAVNRSAAKKSKVSAAFSKEESAGRETLGDLSILYLDNKIDADSRTFRFFVTLPNRIAREDVTPEGRHFVYWRFKPGERMEIRFPVETWKDRIVLPAEAVAEDGAECFVFEANDGHFDRRSVRVEYRDQDSVVIANDGVLKLGVMVAESAAHQIQMAMKNKQGGGVDPHAGHNH
jgi:multidrug efflux pump subunit AcrA (membrane-fusion protein)